MDSLRRVLLVEDTEDDYILTRAVFEEMKLPGYSLDWVKTAAEALGFLQTSPPDVVLLDYELGADTGVEVLQWMQAEGFDGPVIMLTGQSLEGLDQQALEAGAVDYLAKSELDADSLSRSLRFAVLRSEATQARLDSIRAKADLQRAQTISQAKTDFIAYMSHELRTPLAAMLGYTDLLRLKLEDEAMLTYVNTIALNGRHLLSLMGDFLDFSKIEAERLRLDPTQAKLIDLLREAYSVAALQAIEQGVDFQVTISGPLPERLHVDARRLVQMLLNLLGNAVKFSPGGRVIWGIEFNPSADSTDSILRFEITDNGLGIAEDELEHIFQPFEQAANNGTGLGLGLGLAITRSLAQRMGGAVTAKSAIGEGSVFTLTVPVEKGEQPVDVRPRDLQEVQDLERPARALRGNALVVDDAQELREVTAQLLEHNGLNVAQAGDGESALEKIASSNALIDLVLLDMQMPGMQGYDVATRLRASGFTGRIIAFTAAAMDGARERCLAAGCDDYLSKPVESTLLLKKAEYWLRQPQGNPEVIEADDGGRVLVVEDADAVREATVDLLDALGFRAAGAADAAGMLELLPTFQPDAVLLDLNLGGESGLDLARTLAADEAYRQVHRLALSGDQADALNAEDLSLFAEYLEKPLQLAQLEQALSGLGVFPDLQKPL